MDVVAIGTNQPAYVEKILPSDYEICWDYRSLNTNSEYGKIGEQLAPIFS